ncbi:MAG: TRAP transporter large permease [Clostridiales Family XIII bacterium]|jgi:tripartite ATP-independent transporter DctM subunit|nr:TRAP transporter large permease [Clostridiales Family XIII bacterium]
MTVLLIGAICLAGFIVLMFIGVPIPLAMLFPGALGILIIRTPSIAGQMLANELYNTFTSYAFAVGPIFAMMGFFATYSGVGSNLYNAINSFMGHWRGGVAMATTVANAGFGAICGSPPAAVSTFAAIAYPEMRRLDYQPELAGPCISSGATLSVLIPPSGSLIIYGIITENSVGRLFMSGILPGVIYCAINLLVIRYVVWRHPEYGPPSPRHTRQERVAALRRGGLFELIIVFCIAMGGMFAGVFTSTEAGAVGAFGMLVCTLATRMMNWRRFISAMMASVRVNAMLFLLLAGGQVLGKMFTVSTIPMAVGRFVQSLPLEPWLIMVVILAIFMVLGMVVDLLPMTIVTMPIFYPIVVDYLGYDAMWFGVMLVVLQALGGITPPVGFGIFILKGCITDPEATLGRLFRGVWPFVAGGVIAMVIFMVFPEIVTVLPDHFFKG